jgi:hypothetical protein
MTQRDPIFSRIFGNLFLRATGYEPGFLKRAGEASQTFKAEPVGTLGRAGQVAFFARRRLHEGAERTPAPGCRVNIRPSTTSPPVFSPGIHEHHFLGDFGLTGNGVGDKRRWRSGYDLPHKPLRPRVAWAQRLAAHFALFLWLACGATGIRDHRPVPTRADDMAFGGVVETLGGFPGLPDLGPILTYPGTNFGCAPQQPSSRS